MSKLDRFERNAQKKRKLTDTFELEENVAESTSIPENKVTCTLTNEGVPVPTDNPNQTFMYVAEPLIEEKPEIDCTPDFETILASKESDFQQIILQKEADIAKERKMYFKEMDLLRKERDCLQEQLSSLTLKAESLSLEKIKFYTRLQNYGVL